MKRNILRINGIEYDAARVMEELTSNAPLWKVKGLEFLIQLIDPSEVPVKFHTSGTTGPPKEILFSKKQIFYSASNTCRYFNLDRSSKLLLCLPADFVAGRMMMARAFYANAELVWTEPSLNPLKGISGISFAAFTPAQVTTILEDASTRKVFSSIQTVIIGGGELNEQLENELKKSDQSVFSTYGMTETLTHVAVKKIGSTVYSSVYEDAVFSQDDHGCLCIYLPGFSDQRIITNDQVELKDQRSFIWKGRRDHVINTGGIKLYAGELETKILKGGILEQGTFYISSRPDPKFGQVPVIVLLKGMEPGDMAALLGRINGLLNKHEAVKDVVILDKFEYTNTGKLIRKKF